MVVVTGANSKYFQGLKNLVGSIHVWMPGMGVVVFNLGLSSIEKEEITAWRNCELRWASKGPPVDVVVAGVRKHCPHLRHVKKYAWKPVAMLEGVRDFESVLWLDAGSDIRGDISIVRELLAKDGYFLVKGQDLDMTAKLHRGCARRLGLRLEDFGGKPSYAGNTQGYVRRSSAVEQILTPMYTAACDRACVAPFGSSLRNHRYDQSILSLIAYSLPNPPNDHTELLCADRRELSPDPTLPSSQLIYTARASSSEYIAYLERS